MSIAEALVSDFKREAANTRTLLEAVPEEKFDWKPHQRSMSLGELAAHIAETPTWIQGMLEDELDLAAVGPDYTPFIARSKKDLIDTFEVNVKSFEKALGNREDSFLNQNWTMRHGDRVLMSMPRSTAIRSTAIHHTVHHRGQLTVYLRLLEEPVPDTYGPTADGISFF